MEFVDITIFNPVLPSKDTTPYDMKKCASHTLANSYNIRKHTFFAPDAFCEAKKLISHPCASMHKVLFMSWERTFTLQRDKVFPMT